MSDSPDGVRVKYDDNEGNLVAIVKLDRPSRMNSVNSAMGNALKSLKYNIDEATRAIMIVGEGDKAFSTGRDLKESKNHTKAEAKEYMQLCIDSVLAVKKLGIPTVAVINGFAFGWGMELALACDLRVAREDAVMCFPECGLGIFPGAGGTVLLPRLVGPAVAKELIFTAKRFTGAEAQAWGLVNKTASGGVENAYNMGLELTKQIARNAPLGIQGAKVVIDEGIDMTFDDHFILSNKHRFPLNDTHDFKEGIKAFEEKRKPQFKGY